MFHYLRDKPRILVTGLMRSGTTICSEMIAHDTGHNVVREEAIEGEDSWTLPKGTVLQAPIFLEAALEFKAKGWHVVVMMRDFQTCAESTKKFMDGMYPKEQDADLMKILLQKKLFLDMLLDSDMAPMAVRYEDLRLHPLWVEDRTGWDKRQTKSGPIYHTEMGLS